MIKTRSTIIILLCLFCVVYKIESSKCAQEPGANLAPEVFVYNAEGKKDPFLPLVTEDGKISMGYDMIKTVEDIRLEGIAYDPEGESVAIINGMILKRNDMVGEMKLIRINSDSVVFFYDKNEYVIMLTEEQGPGSSQGL
ncbi:MAG: hypothetical protein V2A72_03140 [Candidatus Omnitrophota bacterium]